MASDLEELMRQAAQPPTRPLDTAALVKRARRQMLLTRGAAGLGGLAMLVVTALLVPSLAANELEIDDRSDVASTPTSAVDPEQLWGRTYVSVEVREAHVERELVAGTRVELTFDRASPLRDADGSRSIDPETDGFATWHAGCNRGRSEVSVSQERIERRDPGYTTLMLCPTNELTEQDRWLHGFFRSGPAWRMHDGRLELAVGDTTIVLEGEDATFELGADHIWEGTGSFEEVGREFLAEVLGWPETTLTDTIGSVADEPLRGGMLVFENVHGRVAELHVEALAGSEDRWGVRQVSSGIEQPVSLTESPSLFWRPIHEPGARSGRFEGTTGTAYIRTIERGTVVIPLDHRAVEAAEVSLDGLIDFGEPWCHNIQTTLLRFEDATGEVTSAVGGGWHGAQGADCDTGSPGQLRRP